MASRSPASSAPPTTARQFALDAARLAANTHCHDVIILDVSGVSPVCDYFVIATGTSSRQMRSVADEISELGRTQNFPSISTSGPNSDSWMLIDCVDVIIHLFSGTARSYYDLENLWGDAKRLDIT
jgi:ribosome-associated protein